MAQQSFFLEKIVEASAVYIPKVILAIITLLIGLWVIRLIGLFAEKRMEKKEVEATLKHFLSNLLKIGLKILLIISVISMLGVQMTSFVAVIAAAGLAIGLALQGSLSNFAGGVLIMLFKPFKVGDVIDAQGHLGKVSEIQIFNTILKTPDNKTVIIPNGALSNGSIVNLSTEPKRRVDMTFGISYQDDIKKAKKVLNDIVSKDKRILKDPKPQIVLKELGDSSVNFAVRVWCKSEDYWDVKFDTNEATKLAFDKNKISIPFPQMDVHLDK